MQLIISAQHMCATAEGLESIKPASLNAPALPEGNITGQQAPRTYSILPQSLKMAAVEVCWLSRRIVVESV